MPFKSRLFSFTTLLVTAPLLCWLMILGVPTLRFYLRLRQAAHGAPSVTLSYPDLPCIVPASQFLSFAWDRSIWSAYGSILLIDLPGSFGDVLTSLIVAHTIEWHPASWNSQTWGVCTLPIYAIPAWYFAGRGLDALRKRRRIWGATALFSLLLSSFSLLGASAVWLGSWSSLDRTTAPMVASLALWGCLFSTNFIAWLHLRLNPS